MVQIILRTWFYFTFFFINIATVRIINLLLHIGDEIKPKQLSTKVIWGTAGCSYFTVYQQA